MLGGLNSFCGVCVCVCVCACVCVCVCAQNVRVTDCSHCLMQCKFVFV